MRFEREDPQPIGKDSKSMLEKILKNINYKPDLPLEGNDLDDLLLKIEDSCNGRSVRDDRRGGGRSRIDEDEDDDRRSPSRADDDRRSSSRRDDDRRAPARDERRAPARDDD